MAKEQKEIWFEVDLMTGKTNVEAFGYNGVGCVGAIERLLRTLGLKKKTRLKRKDQTVQRVGTTGIKQ